ncbi:hypothetical protein M409DRAFT_61496 [Zasmidium cellare ATCC 36951]|uniref:RAM signaling network component n=1 Tax=Zasmidium cellare ATCC 36951 TaxID=1080233 RepID=A0A6A6BVN9_ZASCE|nr:uncharacterized protein M409DRAFT_61496 [Zasmidium cellare ATCC 36951]KAF2158603.1 hypothetical protein M409DRAFT_61496 [Zasmidium cellare ATCC 36951]
MASDTSSQPSKPPMTSPELVAFVKKELDADEERQAKVASAGAGEVPRESQTGSTLDLSHKNISSLPVEVIILIKDKVERLAVSHNPRISLPVEIYQCDRLRYLNLRWNKLRQFPDAVLSLPKLEILDISKNAIEAIPEDIKRMINLKFLAVARNQIKRLPLALGEMNLVKLKFDENPIEFPPLDALKPNADRAASMIESEKDKDMCQQVKRFMRAAAVRQKMRTTSEEDMSETNAETPRPPRRGVTGGRFPVRPSVSGIDNLPNPIGDSPPNIPPPIPQRSHARGISSNVAPSMAKRPPLSTIVTGGLDSSRSRSETVATSANIRNRRQGYVPRKNANMMSLSEMSTHMSASPAPSAPPPTAALTPPHSRAPSSASSYRDYLAPGSGGDSGAPSPVDGPVSRANLSRRLASLPESRNSSLPTINSIRAVKRVLYMLFHLYRPVADITLLLKSGSPIRNRREIQLFNANSTVEDLDRLIVAANSTMERNTEIDATLLADIIRTGIKALRKYISLVKDLCRERQHTIRQVDAFHVRLVLNAAHGTIIEARNVCHLLGFRTKALSSRDTLRVSTAGSSRTVTPTQPRSTSTRRRGATILQPGGSVTNLRGMAPPVPLHIGSRSNTMTSMSAGVIPRSNDSFINLALHSNVPSRSNTMRSVTTESDHEDGGEKLYLKMKQCCDLASQLLPPVHLDLVSRKQFADRTDAASPSQYYKSAIEKCDSVITNNNNLLSRLRAMKVGDSARHQRELAQMIESFGRDWTNFVSEIVELTNKDLPVGHIRKTLKPLQHAVKEANRAALLPAQTSSARPPPSASIHGGFPTALNTTMTQTNSHVPPVPATPLGAALGPAVQATVPPTPTTAISSPEYYFPDQPRTRPAPERSQTTLPLPSYPRRDR